MFMIRQLATLPILISFLASAAPAFAQTRMECDGNAWEDGGFPDSNPGDVLSAVGFITAVTPPLAWQPGQDELTWSVSGLVSTGQIVLPGGKVLVSYVEGTFECFSDEDPVSTSAAYGVNPPNPTSPSSFIDGEVLLQAVFDNCTVTFDPASNRGTLIGEITVVGGVLCAEFCGEERSLQMEIVGPPSAPAGYDLQVGGEFLLDLDPNDCAINEGAGGPIAIGAVPFVATGNTCASCNIHQACGGGNGPDVVYSYTTVAPGEIDISLCGSTYNTSLYVTAGNPFNVIACGTPCDVVGPGARLDGLPVAANEVYYIVVDGSGVANCGDYVLDVAWTETPGLVTGVRLPSEDDAITQPAPNPFNGEARMAYVVGGAIGEPVDIAVFDVSGRRTRTLLRGFRNPGRYEAIWNGTDDSGARSPAGTYFFRATIGGETTVRKVSLIR